MEKFLTRQNNRKKKANGPQVKEQKLSLTNVRDQIDKIDETAEAIRNNEIQLPHYFVVLLQQIDALYVILKTMNIRRNIPLFDKIRAAVELQTRQSFTRETLSMMITFLPDGYIIIEYVEDKRKNLPFTMHILLSDYSDKKFHESKEFAKEKMTNLILHEHKKWCQKHKIKVPKVITVLDPKFPLQDYDFKVIKSIKEVGYKEIEPPPAPSKTILDSFQTEIEKRNEEIEPEVQRRAKEFMEQHKVSYSGKRLQLFGQVIKKEIQSKVYKETFGEQAEKVERATNQLRLADMIQATFISRKKKALPIKELVNAIKTNEEFYNIKENSVEDLILGIVSKSNGYFDEKDIKTTKYIRLPDISKSFNNAKTAIYQSSIE